MGHTTPGLAAASSFACILCTLCTASRSTPPAWTPTRSFATVERELKSLQERLKAKREDWKMPPRKQDVIDELTRLANRFREDRDWKQFHNAKDMALSLSLEAAEVL